MSVPKPPGLPPSSTSPHWLRFSTGGLLMLVTAVSLILAIYFGVGRAIGMSNADIVNMASMRLVYLTPMLVVWGIGLLLTTARNRRDGTPRLKTMAVYFAFIAAAITVDLLHMVIIFRLHQGLVEAPGLFGLVTVMSVLINAVWWLLMLMVIFRESHHYLHADATRQALKRGCSEGLDAIGS